MLSLSRPHRALLVIALAVLATGLRAQSASPPSSPAGVVALSRPLGMAYDSKGNLFFADSGNHLIRQLDSAGNLFTVAGTGIQGFSGDAGPALMAQLDTPSAIVLDAAGNLFIADTHNHRIRRIDAVTGLIATIAGTGVAGSGGDNGPAVAAQLSSPSGLAIDSANLLYIADSQTHRVRRLDLQTGIIVTLAGTGVQAFGGDGDLAAKAYLDSPSGLALDAASNLYLSDTGNHRIRRVDALSGVITTIAGASPTSLLDRPLGLAVVPSGLLISDAGRQRVLRFASSSGTLTSIAGQGSQSFLGDGGMATAATLDGPAALAVTSSGAITIADTGNQRIRQVSVDGSISTLAGLGAAAAGTLTLSGATTQSYGATNLVASLSSGATSQGTVSLLDATTGSTTLIGQGTLSAGTVRFNLSSLSAGTHLLLAAFAGDATHRAAQSQTLSVTVAPIPLTASLIGNPASVFGQPLPSLNATLSGALPSDTTRLIAKIATSAAQGSLPGIYAIQITLSGSAAANYVLTVPPVALTIAKAPVSTTLTQNGSTVTAHVVSSTIGTPTGTITLLTSAGTRFSTVLLDEAGAAAISTASLPNGAYVLSAIYSGDAEFLSAQSTALNLTVGPPTTPPDFSFAPASNTAQIVNSGETATFKVGLNTSGTGALAGPITLSSSALPVGFAANFDPPIIPPGGAVTGFTLSVVTPRALAARHLPSVGRSGKIVICLLPFLLAGIARRRYRVVVSSLVALAL